MNPSKFLHETILFYDFNCNPKDDKKGFPLRKDQIIHVGPLVERDCKNSHEFYAITIEIFDGKAILRLCQKKGHFYYSFGADPEFKQAKERGKKFDWRLDIWLQINSRGPKEKTFTMPKRSQLKGFPRIDISTYVVSKDPSTKALHGTCWMYLNNV